MEENKNEMYDVEDEIIETEIIEEEVEVEEESQFSDEEIDTMLLTLKDELKTNNYKINEKAESIAKQIAKNSKDYLDNDTYLWTMFAYTLKYQKENNVNAERYCYIRMKDVLNAMNKKRPQQKALTFKDSDLPEFVIQKSYQDTAFMENEIKNLGGQFIKIEIGIGFLFFAIVKFIFKYSWVVTIAMILLMLYINYRVSYKSIVKKYISEQTKACQNFCKDKELTQFDLPVYNS